EAGVGPAGKVNKASTPPESGWGGAKLFVNVAPVGLVPAGFGGRTFVTHTHVGGFDFIAPQPDRSVDAEPGLAWDTGAAHNGRVYLVYSAENPNKTDTLDIYVRHSDDSDYTRPHPGRQTDAATTNI